ncbi:MULTISPECIES: YhdP family protein [Vibrio]|uniref:YhdP family protein n=1 Tax=Vibrio TaxID=662 RepID=UPI0005EE5206|nr:MULTISPECIES: YhdP family protein [Vibrio]MDK9778931.1 TIGR02099 family protein [Vibrio sp. D401a]MDK9800429.1 TIGR02099 family protein [Vibrio sp. D406a]USD49674.1 TIGR02099 family protein [Vibrio sp. SCSIO 43153]
MNSGFNRFGRVIAWGVVTILVSLAILVTTLRIALPQLNHFQDEIKTWVKQGTGFDFSIASVSGAWRNSHPSIALQGLQANLPNNQDASFAVDEIQIEFDLIQSLLSLKPVVADLTIRDLALDIRNIDFLSIEERPTAPAKPELRSNESTLIDKLDSLLLRQFEDFTITKSQVWYKSISGETRRLDIEQLRWSNQGKHHLAEGTVSIADASLNSLLVRANFTDHGSLRDVSGEFYVSAQEVSVTPWLTTYMQNESGVESGKVSLNTWLTLRHSQPSYAYVDLQPSELVWNEKGRHELLLESGIFKLSPDKKGWKVNGHSLKVRTDDRPWPELDVAFDWQPDGWLLNLSQLDIEALTPLVKLAPKSESTTDFLDKLAPKGRVEDIRLAMNGGLDTLRYSAEVDELGLTQWELLPGFNHVQGKVAGNLDQAKAKVTVIDDVFPYGDVFQAPLNIKQGEVDIIWQQDEEGWRLWSDKVTAATPDLQVLGAFRLDFPKEQSPFLSFYAEADLYNAGETWRYLPTLALGQDLTDYLSTAIQGGKVNTAKLLWYGELGDFPYKEHNGMFQAWVGLKDANFSFDTAWPTITNLQLDLLFENDAMYLDSKSATLNGVKAKRITGRIPELAEGGHIEIEAKASASGNEVRDYMMATPLVDSVGAALTALQVSGPVYSEFQLNIPFDMEKDARAWGYADLKNNRVDIDAPPMRLESATGRIKFDNDVVTTSGLSAKLLNQPISLDFRGKNAEQGYNVTINTLGDWEVDPLKPYLGERWLNLVSGHAPWQMDVELQLNDVGFTYQVDVIAKLNQLASEYPYPLAKATGEAGTAKLQASGNQEVISARLQLPSAKYQTEIDITGNVPELTATNLVIGNGGFRMNPIVGHHASIRLDELSIDRWAELMHVPVSDQPSVLSEMATPAIPKPTNIDLDVQTLQLAGIEFHDVDLTARKKNLSWLLDVNSQEVKGKANYLKPYDLSVSLEHLHLYIPGFDEMTKERNSLFASEDQAAPLISNFDRKFHAEMPNLTLNIDDFWLQGYKVGKVNVELERRDNRLEWKNVTFSSGQNRVDMNGWWELSKERSHSNLTMKVQGENNSDLMERFGITSGIQQAPFGIDAQLDWDGAPWAMKTQSLQGEVSSEFGKGVITEVSGAARLLGLFSLDSIIRKMQLDFTDVFDKGMAFNSITGTGKIQDGVFITNDIVMDALAGEMQIRGIADMNTRLVDAEVKFTPDITSGIPMLTAFAVAPQTALYVLAISTVISPVVEVFTQVNYEVKGPLDSPTVKEISRSKGEYKLPEKLREQAK